MGENNKWGIRDMNEKIRFIRPSDLVIIENENEFILRRGFLHINEIVIDKSGSSKNFCTMMKEFESKKNLNLKVIDDTYEDFLKLTKFGFIEIEVQDNFLILANKNYKNIVDTLFRKETKVDTIENFFDIEDIKVINESKNTIKLSDIYDKYKEKLSTYNHIYYIDDFCYLTRLRGFNKLMNTLDIETTIGFIDNGNIYLTGIKPRYTGCYECLEKHIITKFTGTMDMYEEQYDYLNKPNGNKGDIVTLIGLIMKDIENICKYGSSSLTGNVVHMHTPNFEYSFNINRKNSSCSVCAKVNNVMFEEQNIRSINVIKEAFLND